MILRIVLLDGLNNISGNNISNPNILILDEGFGCLDEENFTEVAGILKKLKRCFKCILIITHINKLKTYADANINIERVGHNSKITYSGDSVSNNKIDSMLEVKIYAYLSDKKETMSKNRIELNKQQDEKKIVKELKKKEKNLEKLKKIDEETMMKKQAKEEKLKKIDEETMMKKQAKVEITVKLNEIMASDDLIKSYIIEEYMNDDVKMFKCCVCDKSYSNSGNKMINHIKSKTYLVKHKKHIMNQL